MLGFGDDELDLVSLSQARRLPFDFQAALLGHFSWESRGSGDNPMCTGSIVGVDPPIVGAGTFYQFLVVRLVFTDDKHHEYTLMGRCEKK